MRYFIVLGAILIFTSCVVMRKSDYDKLVKGKEDSNKRTYTPSDKALYDTIIYQDSLLFDAFNSRDFERFKMFFADSLEIYQDNKGLRNYEQSMDAFKGLFVMSYVLSRQLVKGSAEVYPIKNYGAIETGLHTFCHTENGKLDCGTFKFVNIWKNQNGQWKITRLITYNH